MEGHIYSLSKDIIIEISSYLSLPRDIMSWLLAVHPLYKDKNSKLIDHRMKLIKEKGEEYKRLIALSCYKLSHLSGKICRRYRIILPSKEAHESVNTSDDQMPNVLADMVRMINQWLHIRGVNPFYWHNVYYWQNDSGVVSGKFVIYVNNDRFFGRIIKGKVEGSVYVNNSSAPHLLGEIIFENGKPKDDINLTYPNKLTNTTGEVFNNEWIYI